MGRVKGKLATLPLAVTLRDIGPRGFSVESAQPFAMGARRLFLFTTETGLEVMIEGAVAYSRAEGITPSRYVSGFRFVHSRLTDSTADIALLLDALEGMPELEEEPIAGRR